MGKSKPKDLDILLKRSVTEIECLPCYGRKKQTEFISSVY
jgi:hypothetical protein